MEVEFKLTPEDLIALQRYHKKHPPIPPQSQFNLTRLLFWLAVGAVVVSFLSLRAYIDDPVFDNLFAMFPGVGAGVVLALAGLTLYAQLKAPNATRKALQQGRNAEKVLGWRRISIDARALRVDTEYSNFMYLWWAVDAIVESPDHAFIYFMTNNAFIVPRDAFRTDRAFDEFVQAARHYHRMAGVGDAVREGPGARDLQEHRPPTGIRPSAVPGDAKPVEGIVAPARPDEQPRPGS